MTVLLRISLGSERQPRARDFDVLDAEELSE
jgi:hypothetical protein